MNGLAAAEAQTPPIPNRPHTVELLADQVLGYINLIAVNVGQQNGWLFVGIG